MQIGAEAVATVKMIKKGGKDEQDSVALVAPEHTKEWEARGYKAAKAEAPQE